MTGKKITNSLGKGRNNYLNTANQQTMSVAKKPIKLSTSASTMALTTVSPMANHLASNISPVPVTGVIVQSTPPNLSTLIRSSENSKYIPHCMSALTKPATDLLPAEELDSIQLELEILLSTVALRYRSLKKGFASLDREEKSQKKIEKYTPGGQGKRKRDDGIKKTAKEIKSTQPAKIAKLKTNSTDSTDNLQLNTDDSLDATPSQSNSQSSSSGHPNSKVLVPKNDIPNKFWLSVEPYCMPITQEDIKLLDDMIEEYVEPLVPPIPDLGPHYTTRWATEDLRDEQDNSNPNAKANKRFTNASNADVNNILKKGEQMMAEGISRAIKKTRFIWMKTSMNAI